jgi:hypothetical protein
MENNIVVYRHVRLDTNEVFYIGIGREKRAYVKSDRNKLWKNIVNKTDYRIDILFDDLTWEQACEKEKEFIQLYGRRNLGLGSLVNMTDGGEGMLGNKMSEETKLKIGQGNKGKIISEETKLKMSQVHKGKSMSEEAKLKMSESRIGISISEETKLKISQANKGKKRGPFSEETKLKMSEVHKGKKRKPFSEETKKKIGKIRRKTILQLDLDDNIIREWSGAIEAQIEGGFNQSAISLCLKGKHKTHKGFKWQYK